MKTPWITDVIPCDIVASLQLIVEWTIRPSHLSFPTRQLHFSFLFFIFGWKCNDFVIYNIHPCNRLRSYTRRKTHYLRWRKSMSVMWQLRLNILSSIWFISDPETLQNNICIMNAYIITNLLLSDVKFVPEDTYWQSWTREICKIFSIMFVWVCVKHYHDELQIKANMTNWLASAFTSTRVN